jgi:hypothetical protein
MTKRSSSAFVAMGSRVRELPKQSLGGEINLVAHGGIRGSEARRYKLQRRGKMKCQMGALLFLAIAAFALPAQSQPIDWELEEFQPDIPNGGRANTIAVNPSDNHIMFVASEPGGLFKTTDGGMNWSHVEHVS